MESKSLTFDELCAIFEKYTPEQCQAELVNRTNAILPVLMSNNAPDKVTFAIDIYVRYMLNTLFADGEFNNREYEIIAPWLKAFTGRDWSFIDCAKLIVSMGSGSEEQKTFFDNLVDSFGFVSPEIKGELVSLALLLCGADGKITDNEKVWIARLLN